MRERGRELFAETAIGRTRLDDGAKRLWGRRPGESHLEFGGDIGWVLRFG
jgi:hypothetical protein